MNTPSIDGPDVVTHLQLSAVRAIVAGRFPEWLESALSSSDPEGRAGIIAEVIAAIHDPAATITLAAQLANAPTLN